MGGFNARQARAKRPCPLWVDAFQRDTQHLEADEVGAYFLILMAMWTRETCDFPDDDSRLARVSRVSVRLWKSRIGPTIRAFLKAENGALVSKRLREEARYVERQVTHQSSRKTGEKTDNPLEDMETMSSTDSSTDEPRHYPSQQPNNPTGEASATAAASQPKPPPTEPKADLEAWSDDRLREEVMAAVGVQGVPIPKHWLPPAATMHVGRWRRDLKLEGGQIVAAARASRAQYDTPPQGPKALDGVMQRLAAQVAAGPLRPDFGSRSDRGAPLETPEAKRARWAKLGAADPSTAKGAA